MEGKYNCALYLCTCNHDVLGTNLLDSNDVTFQKEFEKDFINGRRSSGLPPPWKCPSMQNCQEQYNRETNREEQARVTSRFGARTTSSTKGITKAKEGAAHFRSKEEEDGRVGKGERDGSEVVWSYSWRRDKCIRWVALRYFVYTLVVVSNWTTEFNACIFASNSNHPFELWQTIFVLIQIWMEPRMLQQLRIMKMTSCNSIKIIEEIHSHGTSYIVHIIFTSFIPSNDPSPNLFLYYLLTSICLCAA